LFGDPLREIYGREAARTTTLALRTVQRELALLADASLVTSRREGKLRLYRANPRHRLYSAIRQLVIKGDSHRPFVSQAKKPKQRWRYSVRRRKGGL
jgi:DNA-binding transcriptional ArsR family regulator